MTFSEKTQRLQVISDLCELVIEAESQKIIDQSAAEQQLNLFWNEAKRLIDSTDFD